MTPSSSSGRSFQLGDFAEEARRTVDTARQQTLNLLRAAQDRAASIEAEAARKGHDEGYARGQEAGRVAGEQKAYEEVLLRLSESSAEVQQCFESLVETLDERRKDLETHTHDALLTLAIRIAEKILRSTLDRQPEKLNSIAAEALGRLASEEEISVRLHPDDYTQLAEFLPGVVQSMNTSPTVRLVPDSTLERGDVLASGQWGSVDATLRTQLRAMKTALGIESS